MSGTGRYVCYFILYTILLISLISDTSGQTLDRVGPPGVPGASGTKGEKGQKGEKGEVGPNWKDKQDTGDDDDFVGGEKPEPPSHGTAADPATSCQDEKLEIDTLSEPAVYIYPAKPFQVTCFRDDYPEELVINEDSKTCLLKQKSKEFKDEMGYKFSRTPFWLSTAGFDLLKFYDDFQISHISQLKHLLTISYKVLLEILVYCKNTEVSSDPENYLQIHLWDGQNVGPFPNHRSPVYYEIPEELNKCKNLTDETKWETATIKLNAPSNFIKDFYIRDIKEGKEQGIYVQLKEFCIYA